MSLDALPLNTLHKRIDEALPGEPELKRECHDLATSRCAGERVLAGRAPIPAAMSYSGGASKVWLHGPTPRGRYGGKAFIDIHDVERELAIDFSRRETK